jgi:hypothetical protein
MRVRLQELDARLARAIVARRWQPWRQVAARMSVWLLFLFAVFLGMGPRSAPLHEELVVWFGLLIWICAYYGRQLARLFPSAPLTLSRDELRAACWEIVPSPAERAYLETLQRLSDAAPSLGETTARELLPHLGELLENARQLDRQRERVRAAFGPDTAADLEMKCADLSRRHEAASDAVVQQALHQSRELCRERLQGLHLLERSLSRVEAQQELVQQTFASVQATLARAQVAPNALSAPDLQAIAGSLTAIGRQTRAVEQALHEVAGP